MGSLSHAMPPRRRLHLRRLPSPPGSRGSARLGRWPRDLDPVRLIQRKGEQNECGEKEEDDIDQRNDLDAGLLLPAAAS